MLSFTSNMDNKEKAPSPEARIAQLEARVAQLEAVLKTDSFEVLTGRSNPELARRVGDILKLRVDEPVTLFADGESNIQISNNLRRRDVYIIQPTSPPVNESIIDLYLMIKAAKRASAEEVTAVIPYYGYARQDRKDKPRKTISASDVANIIEMAGIKRVLTIDIHTEQTEGSVRTIPWDNIYASAVLFPKIGENLDLKNVVVASPDVGGSKRAEKVAHVLGQDDKNIAIVEKKRKEEGKPEARALIGEVDGMDILLVDDMIDSATTITEGAKLIKSKGARSITIAATHGLFTGEALDRIETSPVDKVYITDTIKLSEKVLNSPKIEVVSVAPLLAEAIKRMHTGESLSELILRPQK